MKVKLAIIALILMTFGNLGIQLYAFWKGFSTLHLKENAVSSIPHRF